LGVFNTAQGWRHQLATMVMAITLLGKLWPRATLATKRYFTLQIVD